jgi:hypothetical protein
MWQEIEGCFNRAFKLSYTRKKILLVLPVLFGAGILVVLSHSFWIHANPWLKSSLAFVPLFLSAGIFITAAVPLIRLYHDEVKEKRLSITQTLKNSWVLMGQIASLVIPILTVYLVLWFIMGVFYLLKNIPGIGEALGVVLSFGPFLLILGSCFLSIINLMLLFFMPPMVALKSNMKWELAEEVLLKVANQPFLHLVLLSIGLMPLLVIVGFLVLAATLTGMSLFIMEGALAITLQWFFIMVPFAILLSPAVIFFFNFAAESYIFLQRRGRH